jgi:hypothetical protein
LGDLCRRAAGRADHEQAAAEAEAGTLGWLAAAGYGYQALRGENAERVKWMSRISGALGALMILQTIAWLTSVTTPKPTPPTEIKPPSTSIGIGEGRGGSSPPRPSPQK